MAYTLLNFLCLRSPGGGRGICKTIKLPMAICGLIYLSRLNFCRVRIELKIEVILERWIFAEGFELFSDLHKKAIDTDILVHFVLPLFLVKHQLFVNKQVEGNFGLFASQNITCIFF